MSAYPEDVRSPGQIGSRRGLTKPTRMTDREQTYFSVIQATGS
jgi:hypothetical protein